MTRRRPLSRSELEHAIRADGTCDALFFERRMLVAGRFFPGQRPIGGGWRPPEREGQLTFFPLDTAQALAEAAISIDEAVRWHERAWLSFDPREEEKVDRPRLVELAFLRSLARSGLSDAQISAMLSGLPRPYSYHPELVAYSFAYGWVQLPVFFDERELDTIFEQHFEDWLAHLVKSGDRDRLDVLRDQIVEAIENADAAAADDQQEEESP